MDAELDELGEGEAQQVEARNIEPANVFDDFTADTLGAAFWQTRGTPRVGGLEVRPQRAGLLGPVFNEGWAGQTRAWGEDLPLVGVAAADIYSRTTLPFGLQRRSSSDSAAALSGWRPDAHSAHQAGFSDSVDSGRGASPAGRSSAHHSDQRVISVSPSRSAMRQRRNERISRSTQALRPPKTGAGNRSALMSRQICALERGPISAMSAS